MTPHSNDKLQVLHIAEAANPEWVSVPLVGWSLANALRAKVNAHLVTQIRNREAILRAGLIEEKDFTAIDSEKVAKTIWRIVNVLRGGAGKGWTIGTALNALSYYYFEYLVWKKFGAAIKAGKFDIVHRITPLSPTTPSLLAKKCAASNVPFILGPLNGGVPWPKGFDAARRNENEWLSYIRSAYKLLPGYRSTLKHSKAIIAGSKYTLSQIPAAYRSKCHYIPENAVNPERFSRTTRPYDGKVLRACFVGRLVPYKGADMLLEATAPLLRDGKLLIDIIGDGPDLPKLKAIANDQHIPESVRFHGWVNHAEIQEIMCESQILAFPSIREFGGGVVLEAMALGIVPIVVDYAGPGELVDDEIGYKVPIGTRQEIIENLRITLSEIIQNPERVAGLSLNCRNRVREKFTWEKKADQVAAIYLESLR